MSPTFHFLSLRLGRVILLALFSAGIFAIVTRGAPAAELRAGAWAFLWWILLLPVALGWMFSSMIHESLHTSTAMLLPRTTRRHVWGHVPMVAAAALACGGIATLVDNALPVPAAVALAAAAFTFTLPFEPGFRWAGFRPLAWLLGGAFLIITETAAGVRASVLSAPITWTVGGLVWTLVNFWAAFALERRRTRANTPYTSFFSAVFNTSAEQRRGRQRMARKSFRRVSWKPAGSPNSPSRWLRAWRHERTGELSGINNPLGFAILGTLFSALFSGPSGLWAENAYRYAVNTSKHAPTNLIMIVIITVSLISFPRCQTLYPLSREDRPRIIFLGSVRQLGVAYFLPLGTLLAAGLGAARWIGASFSWGGYADVVAVVACAAPFAPLAIWGRLHREITNSRWPFFLTTFISMMGAMVLGRYLKDSLPLHAHASTYLSLWCIATMLSHLLLFIGLRRFYRRGDLVQQGAAAQAKFGLV
jgi:hypothetical protein